MGLWLLLMLLLLFLFHFFTTLLLLLFPLAQHSFSWLFVLLISTFVRVRRCSLTFRRTQSNSYANFTMYSKSLIYLGRLKSFRIRRKTSATSWIIQIEAVLRRVINWNSCSNCPQTAYIYVDHTLINGERERKRKRCMMICTLAAIVWLATLMLSFPKLKRRGGSRAEQSIPFHAIAEGN